MIFNNDICDRFIPMRAVEAFAIGDGELAKDIAWLSDMVGLLLGDEPPVRRVLFNNQATVVFWADGEKTVVKCRECGDGRCVFDKGFEVPPDGVFELEPGQGDMEERIESLVGDVARCEFCKAHFDYEKAVMAAMLKRLYPNYQDVLREALGDDDG